jgi:hypothetical protein
MQSTSRTLLAVCLALLSAPALAQEGTTATYDAALATRLGADERGMHRYVLVILRTGPTRVPDGDARKAMFAGHFANWSACPRPGSWCWQDRSNRTRPDGVACSCLPSTMWKRPKA